jgi:polyhydroxyalkanoate synthesis regulator protein
MEMQAKYRIKRYPNRKLYDLAQKKYINLSEVLALVRQGEEIQVDEFRTGQEMTGFVLAEALATELKRQDHHETSFALSMIIREITLPR